jgi:hypothetical protein
MFGWIKNGFSAKDKKQLEDSISFAINECSSGETEKIANQIANFLVIGTTRAKLEMIPFSGIVNLYVNIKNNAISEKNIRSHKHADFVSTFAAICFFTSYASNEDSSYLEMRKMILNFVNEYSSEKHKIAVRDCLDKYSMN